MLHIPPWYTLPCKAGGSPGRAEEGFPVGCQQILKDKVGREQTLQERMDEEKERVGIGKQNSHLFIGWKGAWKEI